MNRTGTRVAAQYRAAPDKGGSRRHKQERWGHIIQRWRAAVIDTGYALYRPREARQTPKPLLLSVHFTLWSVITASASCTHAS